MLKYNTSTQLNEYAKKLLAFNSKIRLGTTSLTPINYTQEKEKFLKSDIYNPQFIYSKQNTNGLQTQYENLVEEFQSIKLSSDLHFYISEYLESLSTTLISINSIGTLAFGEVIKKTFLFPKYSAKDFLQKMQSITFNDPGNCVLKNAEEMSEIFKKYLENSQLDYSVEIDYHNDHIIRVSPQKLVIGAEVKRFCNNIQRLITHEIDSHILQRHNLLTANSPLLRILSHGESLLWAEGLAVYNEIHSGLITKSAFETYYYRLKAVQMIDKSFREIFDYLSRYVTPQKAFMITYRVKRGMSDTSLPGGYTKDASYALGYLTVDEYIRTGGCIEMLYISRVPQKGQVLLDNDLISPTSICLPQYLRKPLTNNLEVVNPLFIH
jgi:hypothetical protein